MADRWRAPGKASTAMNEPLTRVASNSPRDKRSRCAQRLAHQRPVLLQRLQPVGIGGQEKREDADRPFNVVASVPAPFAKGEHGALRFPGSIRRGDMNENNVMVLVVTAGSSSHLTSTVFCAARRRSFGARIIFEIFGWPTP